MFMNMSVSTPRQRRQAKTRQEILEAALALINEKGPDKLTLRALARRVDYSPAGLYEYFDGKDDILAAVCAEGDRRLQQYLRAVDPGLHPVEYLVELGLAYGRFAGQNMEHFLLMFGQAGDDREPLPYEALQIDETYQILLDAVQRGINEGIFAARDDYGLTEIAYGLWALAHGLAVLPLTNLRHIEYDFEAANRVTLETFIHGLGVGTG
jgi:AcrR family transcriptional regulator